MEEGLKVLASVDESHIHDLKRRELIKYIFKLRKFVTKQHTKITYQKTKIAHLKDKIKELSLNRADRVSKEDHPDVEVDNQKESPNVSSPETEKLNFIDDIKNAAEKQSLKNGFIYEPTSGLYYDTSTGYYYNAEYGLYYDGNTGKYYSFDQNTKEFVYHSTVTTSTETTNESLEQPAVKKKKLKLRDTSSIERPKADELEDGEISSDDSCECSSEDEHIFDDISKHYPPSLRLIVQQSSNEAKLKKGTLFLVTCKGGTLGRELENDVVIPDINVSKVHLRLSYDETGACYRCQDTGSRNGTLLNGQRMSESTEASAELEVPHGSVIQISETKLVCHVHPGSTTCGNCEPGLLMEQPEKESSITTNSVGVSHKSQLKMLQRKYGLEKEKYAANKKDSSYNDRAEQRRETVGSSNPNEKTATASVDESIPLTNKGFKMLSKLGWKEGQGLGRNADAIVEPIQVRGNQGTMGLGSSSSSAAVQVDKRKDVQKIIWKKTRERYTERTKVPVNIFGESDDEDGEKDGK